MTETRVFQAITFALDDGDVAVELPPELGIMEDTVVLLEAQPNGSIILTVLEEPAPQ